MWGISILYRTLERRVKNTYERLQSNPRSDKHNLYQGDFCERTRYNLQQVGI
jgi:hypothetical protein